MIITLRCMQAILFTLLFFYGYENPSANVVSIMMRSIAVFACLTFCWCLESKCLGRELGRGRDRKRA